MMYFPESLLFTNYSDFNIVYFLRNIQIFCDLQIIITGKELFIEQLSGIFFLVLCSN